MKKFLVLIIFILLIPQALGSPTSHIDENVATDFYMNGTAKTEPQRIGRVSVVVNNNRDVLQYMELNLSGTGGTNLQLIPGSGDVRAHRATAASPNTVDKTYLYVNTTEDEESLYYTLDSGISPLVNLSMDYSNRNGGLDMHSGSNIFDFSMNVSTDYSTGLDNVILLFEAYMSPIGPDAINILSFNATYYDSLDSQDSDGDGFKESLEWVGDLVPGSTVTINFEGEIEPGVNFDNTSFTFLDLAGECQGYYQQSQTFSGITFKNRFSRGPVREGIELNDLGAGQWSLRGFLKNIAHETGNLDYSVESWALYEVGQTTPLDSSVVSQTLGPGETIYTDRYDTGRGDKLYYSSSFDWEVVWGSSVYRGDTTSDIDMPYLYLIDSSVSKFAVIEQNDQDGRKLSISDRVTHIGDSLLEVTEVSVNSTIPHLSDEGQQTAWNLDNIQVLYRSGGNETDITSLVYVFSSGSSLTTDGYVNVYFTSADIGQTMQKGDEVLVEYDISGSCKDSDLNYTLATEAIIVTESGTPDYTVGEETVEILGVDCGGEGPGGGGGGPSREDAWIMAEDAEAYVIVGNLAKVKVLYRIYDTGTKGLRDMGMAVFIPENGNMLRERTSLELMRNGEWEKLTQGQDYRLDYLGLVSVGEKRYNQYTIDFLIDNGRLNLYDQDKTRIEYDSELPYGLNELITEASGYNYYRDKIVTESVHSLIRIDVRLSKFSFFEEGWEQGIAEVGSPVMWIKEIRVKNPNEAPAEESYVSKVFKDTLTAKIITEDGESKDLNVMPGSKVSWGIRLEPKEEKRLYLQAFTPPVLETLKSIDPLFSNETWVTFDMNSTIKNFAIETYENVTYPFPYSADNIIYHEGIELLVPKGDETSIIMGDMVPGENKSFYLRYIQKPPILIVTTNGYNFTNMDIMDVQILVIPTEEEESGYVEMEVIGPVPRLKTNYGDAMDVEGEKGSINEFNRSVGLDSFVPGSYMLVTNFKKDFATVLTDEKEIQVGGGELLFELGYNLLLLILLVFILITFGRIKKKRDEFREELRKLKRDMLKEKIKSMFKIKKPKEPREEKEEERDKDIYQENDNI